MQENTNFGYDTGYFNNNINEQNPIYSNTQYPRSRLGLNEITTNNFRPRMTRNNNPIEVEVPGIKFGKHEGNLNLNYIKNLDLNGIIRTNNLEPLEKIAQNLVYSEIKAEDYQDENVPKLLQIFQYAIEYLYAKQTKLETSNQDLDIKYNELINYSYNLEEQLLKNKNQIAKNSANKKEKEFLLMTYKSIVDFNCNPVENENIIINNINSTSIGNFQRNGTTFGGKFYCHICSGKPFSTESALESHMKRRHLAQTKLDYQREREDKREEESYAIYEKKIDDMKNYFQTMINAQNEENARNKYNDDLNQIRRENEEKFKFMENYTKNILEELKNMVQTNMLQQEQNNQNIIAMTTINREKETKIEPQKIVVGSPSSNEINNLTRSIEQINDLIKKQNDKKIEEMQNEIRQLREQSIINQNKQPQEKIIVKEIYKENPTNIPNYNYNQMQPQNNNLNVKKDSPPPSNYIQPNTQNKEDEKINENNKNVTTVQQQTEIKTDNSNVKKSTNEIITTDDKNNNEIPNSDLKINQIEVPDDINNIENTNLNKTAPNFKNKKIKLLEVKPNLNRSGEFSELDDFYVKFKNRDRYIMHEMDEKNPQIDLYLEKIIPENRRQDDEKINEDTSKVIDDKVKNLDFENKETKELLEVIEKTLKNINEINSNNDVSNLYYETVQKAINLKLFEEDEKLIKNAYDSNGQLKRSRSSSKAKKVIDQVNNENLS